MFSKFLFIFLYLIFKQFNKILSVKVHPDDYKLIDNPYENDIESSSESYNYIITSVATFEYIDFYKGIHYKNNLCCCYYSYSCYSTSRYFNDYLSLSNINDTNLKELHRRGCVGCVTENGANINIIFDYRRYSSDSLIAIKMRLTNIYNESMEIGVGACRGYRYDSSGYLRYCTSKTILDTFIIPNNSFAIYTFKLDQYYYYLESENFKISHDINGLFSPSSYNYLYLFFDQEKELYLNSYIVSVDLKKYFLSLSGHAHNYCTSNGCLNYDCYSRYSSYISAYYYKCEYSYTECSYHGCVPGSYCNSQNICLECNYQCKGCVNKDSCKSCYITATYPTFLYDHKYSSLNGPCIFEFFPLNKAMSLDIDVPIPLNYRMTFEFWIYIHDPRYLQEKNAEDSLSSFILKDFFTISLHKSLEDINSVIFALTPFEFFYPFDKSYITMNDFYEKYINNYQNIQYITSEIKNCTSKWIYVRGGISYPHGKIFINDNEQDLKFLPFYYENENINYNFYMRKFYRKYDTTLLKIQGFEYIGTDVYIRNFNLYSEYMFNKINNPNYFNIHEITDILTYPQLLFSIPFTNIGVDTNKFEVTYKLYDYSGQLNENDNNVLITDIKSKFIRDYLAPTKNFYRLNFLSFANNEYKSTDIERSYINILCPSNQYKKYCYDDDQVYICNKGYNLMPKYEKKNIQENLTNITNITDLIDINSDSSDFFSDLSDINDYLIILMIQHYLVMI